MEHPIPRGLLREWDNLWIVWAECRIHKRLDSFMQPLKMYHNIYLMFTQVSDDQKTHKNPALREGPKPFAKGGSAKSVAPSAPTVKPPRLVLEGKKW